MMPQYKQKITAKKHENLPMRILMAFLPKSLLNTVDNVSPIA